MGNSLFGGALGFGSPIGAIGGAGLGGNGVLESLGLSGAQGDYYNPSNPALNQMNQDNQSVQDSSFQGLQDQYAQGNMSMGDAIGNSHTQAQKNQLATGATTGSQFATDQVRNNPILGKLFGDKGELNNSINTEQNLQNRGFSLQPQDVEAYGQESGNIARLFGQSENNLAQSLASRGLGGAPSGAAGAQFSGLNGNKNEQLAQAQMKIANDRMQNTMQRIGQQQQFISQLGQQAGNDINQQYERQLQGAQNYQGNLENAAGAQNQFNNSSLASTQDKRNAAGKTLFGALGQGLYSGVASGSASAVGGGMGGKAGAAGATKTQQPQEQGYGK